MPDENTTMEAIDVRNKLYLPIHIVARRLKRNRYLILDPDQPSWIVVNRRGKEFMKLFDGKRDLSSIIDRYCARNGESFQDAFRELIPFIEELQSKSFLSEKPFPIPESLKKDAISLRELYLHLTNYCNLRCIHCYADSGISGSKEMNEEGLMHAIDSFSELDGKRIIFTGGEPLLRDCCLKIIQYARKKGIRNITLLTNGILIDDEIAARLKECNVLVQVSLDGAEQETNDRIRGTGTFNQAIDGLKKLMKAGVHTRIGMTITRLNMHEMAGMAELSRILGLNSVHFSLLQLRGRAKKNVTALDLTLADYLQVRKSISHIYESPDMHVFSEDAFRRGFRNARKHDFCGAGSAILSIASNGDVYPCVGLHESRFFAGNILNQSLESIYRKSKVLQELRELSVLHIPECRSCGLKFLCGGGCHSDTFSTYGTLNKSSPRCEANKLTCWHLLERAAEETLCERK